MMPFGREKIVEGLDYVADGNDFQLIYHVKSILNTFYDRENIFGEALKFSFVVLVSQK